MLTHTSTLVNQKPNTSNIDNVIGNSNPPCINVQAKSSLNTLIKLQIETDTDSSVSINNETIDGNYSGEEISFHQN